MALFEKYLADSAAQFEEELCELLRIPSVSADSAYRDDVRRAGNWVADQFRAMGLKTEVFETPGHPIIYAESLDAPGAPTVLVYGHYDVQPPDPLDLWISPPFEPTRRNGNLYARGATDDKGQMFTHIKSAEAWVRSEGRLPINLKYLIEGEEEVGSEHLEAFIVEHRRRLACDVVVISDTCQFAPGRPAITYGLKGIAYFELRLTGPNRDLHSGSFGGAVANPANALVKMLAALVNDRGRVQVPGFYDDVVPLADRERRQMAELGFDERAFMQELGVDALAGEEGYTTIERRWARPTCDINGLTSGYQGEGSKTVLPSKASAKFSFRLVPKQDPIKLQQSLEAMLRRACPPGITMHLTSYHAAPGVVVSLDNPYMAAAARAIEHGFGKPPVYIREGGSIPVVSTFKDTLGVDTLLLGWGLNDDNTHSPNEKFCLADFHRGIRASAFLWDELSNLSPRTK
ncbi:MAG TPA: dipeptidase [Pirellulales bacterium]|jgi:succinyl-diaminopimelate desuccinylase|nr:dipeptidase [Pirellulales bacterium]